LTITEEALREGIEVFEEAVDEVLKEPGQAGVVY
jgi:hypothetical protein